MKKKVIDLAIIILCISILAGCSSSGSSSKKRKHKEKETDEITETEEPSEEETTEEPSTEPTKESETSQTSEETTTEETTTSETTEESQDYRMYSDWLFDDTYYADSQTPEGKKSFGSVPLCPGYEFTYDLQYTSAISKDFTADEPLNLDDYFFFLDLMIEAGEQVEGYQSLNFIPNDPNSPIEYFDVMIYEEVPYDPPTKTYVIIKVKEDVGDKVYSREFQEYIYPYIEALYGTYMANIMMYSSDVSLGYMRRIMLVDGYARAPEYHIQRLVNSYYLEFSLFESTSMAAVNETGWEDFAPST